MELTRVVRRPWRILKRVRREWSLRFAGVPRLSTRWPQPPPGRAPHEEGICAVGGDLEPSRLLAAYAAGAFPLFEPGEPILWRAPDPRYVLDLAELRTPREVARIVRQRRFEVTLDSAFDEVIAGAAAVPRHGEANWIDPRLVSGFRRLHRLGYAHSVECWLEGRLVAGAYGLSLGAVFFGESAFSRASNAGNVALVTLHEQLREWGFAFVDCQTHSPHLERFGQRAWTRETFLERLRAGLGVPAEHRPWSLGGPSPLRQNVGVATVIL